MTCCMASNMKSVGWLGYTVILAHVSQSLLDIYLVMYKGSMSYATSIYFMYNCQV